MGKGPSLREERGLLGQGYRSIAGLDEAGRGAWAGPVVAGAVILPLDSPTLAQDLAGIRDSKRLTPLQRDSLYGRIAHRATALGVGLVGSAWLDQSGVVPATRLAMTRALDNLAVPADYLLIDFLSLSYQGLPRKSIAGGDDISFSIAAASIVAKVLRDRMMVALDGVFPGYGFGQHKGYGTPQHREALRRLGPSPVHRFSYAPMRFMTEGTKEGGRNEQEVAEGRRALGRRGEQIAARHLERQGYVICEVNYRCGAGEIDIVALDGDRLAFVEVRTRRSTAFGSPAESVTAAKKRKLIEVAQTYLQEHECLPLDWRIDVVSIQLTRSGKLKRLELIKNAVEG